MRSRRDGLALLTSVGVTYGAAAVGGAATATSVRDWYQALDKPAWRPPDSAFGPVWTALYGQMAVAAWLAWRAGNRDGELALPLYGTQLVLNAGWSLVFFGLRRPGLALLEIAALEMAIVATVLQFRRRSRPAALLMLPYLTWTTFATALTFSIWRRNR